MYFAGSGTKTDKKKTNPRQGTDWCSANLLCFPICFSNQILVRIIGRNDEKTRRWMTEFYFYTRENLRYQQGNPSPAHQAWKRLVKRSGHVVNHVVRRKGLRTSTASAVPREVLFQKEHFLEGKSYHAWLFWMVLPRAWQDGAEIYPKLQRLNFAWWYILQGIHPWSRTVGHAPLAWQSRRLIHQVLYELNCNSLSHHFLLFFFSRDVFCWPRKGCYFISWLKSSYFLYKVTKKKLKSQSVSDLMLQGKVKFVETFARLHVWVFCTIHRQ